MKRTHIVGKAHGNSMRPFIEEGDRLYIKKAVPAEFTTGDIVIIRSKSGFLAHRIIRLSPPYAITKGDNSLYADEPVRMSNIYAKAMKIKKTHGLIDLASDKTRFATRFFLFYSKCLYSSPKILRSALSRIFFFRSLFISLITQDK